MTAKPDRRLRLPEVRALTGMASRTIYYAQERGEFPKSMPIYPGARNVSWSEAEVIAHLESCKKERDNKIARDPAAKVDNKRRSRKPRTSANAEATR